MDNAQHNHTSIILIHKCFQCLEVLAQLPEKREDELTVIPVNAICIHVDAIYKGSHLKNDSISPSFDHFYREYQRLMEMSNFNNNTVQS